MAFRLTDGPGRGPHPTEVAGYERARTLGLLPSVPAEPPSPVVFSSMKAMWGFVAFTFGMFPFMPLADGPIIVIPVLLGFTGIVAGILVTSRLQLREFEAGYARIELMIGSAVGRRIRFQGAAGVASGPEWDLRGLWLLDRHDRPVRPPVEGVMPPGYYPSPSRPGQLEYWTVRDWTEAYQQPAVPFLETPTST
ncbi:hypothetical protein [Nocardioides astragali]|uniref:DUF2510 domain-containing protein n=1 Tax=Nocardioides astragali TaxID=1776736 RepID=A0ABW2N4M2_9ACTN|nr:hypothetical protein [Nocardioides astragali]